MDSSIHHNPFIADNDPEILLLRRGRHELPAARLRRAGATPGQLELLEAEFATMTGRDQQGLLDRLAGISDRDIARLYLQDEEAAAKYDQDLTAVRALLDGSHPSVQPAGPEDGAQDEETTAAQPKRSRRRS